jgi:hypothetical protein
MMTTHHMVLISVSDSRNGLVHYDECAHGLVHYDENQANPFYGHFPGRHNKIR